MKRLILLISLFVGVSAFAQTKIHYEDQDTCEIFIPNVLTVCCGSVHPWSECHVFRVFTECEYDAFEMTIFNRWGEIIFQSDDIDKGWNPFETESHDGVYIYILKLTSDKDDPDSVREIRGHVTFLN